jgi:hypothetical protein
MEMTLIDIIKSTPMYAVLLEQVPEEQRAAALADLTECLRPYEALCSSLPPSAIASVAASMGQPVPTDKITQTEGGRRPPRRF